MAAPAFSKLRRESFDISEKELSGKLHEPRIAGTGDSAESAVCFYDVRIVQVRSVLNIEHVPAQLQIFALREMEVLGETRAYVKDSWSLHLSETGATKRI